MLIILSSISSVQFSRSVVSDSLQPHGLQHARHPCPSPAPGACSNSSPLSRWCHPIISSSVVPFSSCLQSFPASGSFPRKWQPTLVFLPGESHGRGAWQVTVHGVTRVRHDLATKEREREREREGSLHQVAKVLEFQLQHQTYPWTPGTDLL